MYIHTHTYSLPFLNSLLVSVFKQIKASVILSFVTDIKSCWLKQSAYANLDKSYLYAFAKQFQNWKQGCISQAFAPYRARPKEIFLPDSLGFFFFLNKCEVNCNSTVISLPDSLWVLAYGCHGNLIILACSLHILFVSLDFLIIQETLLKKPPVSPPLPLFWAQSCFFCSSSIEECVLFCYKSTKVKLFAPLTWKWR